MFDRFQQYLFLMVVLYLLGCLVHDICVYHDLVAENTARIEIEKQTRDHLSHRLDKLIRLMEEEQLASRREEKLKKLRNRLND